MIRNRLPPAAPIVCIGLAAVILAGAYLLSSRADQSVIERRGFLMGTVVEIKAVAGTANRQAVSDSVDRAYDEMARIERALSIYNPDSDVCRLNAAAATAPVRVSDELYSLIENSVAWHGATKGVFDITILPLKRLWTEAARKGIIPGDDEVKKALASVGSSAIRLDPAARTVFFEKPGMSIDLGGIAKGYAVDRATAVLRSQGVTAALINAGGDLYCLGERSPGKAWVIGIQHPRNRASCAYEFKVRDRGVDTSGDYERFSVIGGKRFSHIIDPRSGIPVADTNVSATVISRDSLTSDALATALCILGEPGLRIAETAGADALILTKGTDGRITTLMTRDLMEKYDVTKDRI